MSNIANGGGFWYNATKMFGTSTESRKHLISVEHTTHELLIRDFFQHSLNLRDNANIEALVRI